MERGARRGACGSAAASWRRRGRWSTARGSAEETRVGRQSVGARREGRAGRRHQAGGGGARGLAEEGDARVGGALVLGAELAEEGLLGRRRAGRPRRPA